MTLTSRCFRKDMAVLGTAWKRGVPVEVVEMAYRPVQLTIARLLGGTATLRMATQKAVSSLRISLKA